MTPFERLTRPDYLATLSEAELQAEIANIKQMSRLEKVTLLEILSEQLLVLVSGFPELILEGLDQKLAEDLESKQETQALLARIMKP